MIKIKKSQRGFLAIAAIIIIVIFAVIGVMATYLVNSDILSSTNHLRSEQALYIAEAGLEGGAHQLTIPTIANRTACTGITGNANLTNYTFSGAAGPFTVTGTGPQSPTASTLSAAISAGATTIPLTSTATYASTGRIMIDRELIDYTTISGNNFINVRRGVAGTTAVAHASGAPVGQYQCMLQSAGGVPTLAPAGNVFGGGRTIKEALQLPEAWSVGNGGNTIHWNKPTEKTWISTSTTITGTMNAITILSYADAWAVGNSIGGNFSITHWNGNAWGAYTAGGTARDLFGISCTASNNCETVGSQRTILVWNGSAWTAQSTAALPNVQLNSVYCVTASDCWAVGNTSSGEVFAHWNGTTWSRDPSRPAPAQDLNSVWCTSSNNCWAVGAARTFVQWNGTAWSTAAVAALPNVNYNGVTCVNATDCWAVGQNSGGSVIVHWNGAAWSRVTAPLTVNLNSVNCSKTNSCWAVGSSGSTLYWDGISWTSIANPLGNVILRGVFEVGPATQPVSAWQEQFP